MLSKNMDETKNDELIPTKIAKNNNKVWVVIFVALLVAVVLGGSYIIKNIREKNTPSIRASKEKNDISGNSQISIPELNAKKSITQAEMPVDLVKFLPNTAKNVMVYSVQFKNNSKGIYFSYDIESMSLSDIFNSQTTVASFNKWEALDGGRADEYAFADFKNNTYNFDIQFTTKKSGAIYVEGTAIEITK